MIGQGGFDLTSEFAPEQHAFMPSGSGLCSECGRHRGDGVHDGCVPLVRVPVMPGGKAVARSGDQVTAHVAPLSITDLRPRQRAVYDVLRSIQPATDEQIVDEYRRFQRAGGSIERADQLGIPDQTDSSIRSRRAELVVHELVVAVDREGKTRAGGASTRWAVKAVQS